MFWRSKNKTISTGPLTAEERKQAATVGVFLVNLHGDSPSGWPGHLLRTLEVCLTWDDAREASLRLHKDPELDDLRMAGPRYLLELYDHGEITHEKARELLENIRHGKAYKKMPLPLTDEEKKQAESIQIYYIWYEDQFHYGGDRDSFATLVCLSKEEADNEMKKRKPVKQGSDGYSIVGPCSLGYELHRPGMVREVLSRIKKGRRGPVPIPSEMW